MTLLVPYQQHSETSFAAAEAIAPHLGALQEKVLTFIRNSREIGATDEEIQFATEMAGNTARPRRVERTPCRP